MPEVGSYADTQELLLKVCAVREFGLVTLGSRFRFSCRPHPQPYFLSAPRPENAIDKTMS